MFKLEQAVGKTQLVHYFHHRRVEGIATKVAIKVQMLFKKYDRNALASQEQSQNCSGRTTTNDTTGCLFYMFRIKCLCGICILHGCTSKVSSSRSLAADGKRTQHNHCQGKDEQGS